MVSFAALWAVQVRAQPATQAVAGERVVIHDLSFPELLQQTVHVTSRIPLDNDDIELRLPTWAPGSYVQKPFDASLEVLEVVLDGEPASWRKTEKDTWVVNGTGAELLVRYRVHAAERSVSESWASDDYVLLTGSSVLLYTEGSRDLPQRLSVEPPPGMTEALVPLPLSPDGSWMAADYDELVDSPVLLGMSDMESFNADGARFHLVQVGEAGLWDTVAATDALEAVVRETNDLFGDVPLERDFWFINLLNEENGGLEHDHATVLQASRWQWRDRSGQIQWLSLAAHEYFHVWNVRRMRPAALARYDYRREQYTGSLWIAEGVTSYYDDLLLSRAELVSPSEYLERLATHIHSLELTPGRLRQSLTEGSLDSWTRHYQPGTNAINRNISYYVKGAVVAFVLDGRLRADSRGRRSLDDVMREMWSRWGATPYPEDAFYEAVEAISDADTVAWLKPMVEGVAEPDVDRALAWYGLKLERNPARSAAEATGSEGPGGLGINWESEAPALVVADVIAGGAASVAGVIPGDELLAVNDERLTRDDAERKIARLTPGDPVRLLVSRAGRIKTLEGVLGEARPRLYQVQAELDFGERQRRRLQNWLGQSLSVD